MKRVKADVIVWKTIPRGSDVLQMSAGWWMPFQTGRTLLNREPGGSPFIIYISHVQYLYDRAKSGFSFRAIRQYGRKDLFCYGFFLIVCLLSFLSISTAVLSSDLNSAHPGSTALASIASGTSPSNHKDVKDNYPLVESTLSDELSNYHNAVSHEQSIMNRLGRLEQEVEKTKQSIEECRRILSEKTVRCNRLQKVVKQMKKSRDQLEAAMGRRLVSLYKYAKNATATLLFDVPSTYELSRRMRALKAVFREDMDSLYAMSRAINKKEARIRHAEEELEVLELENKKRAMILSKLQQDLNHKLLELVDAHREREFYLTAVKELRSSEQGLQKAISRMESQETSYTQKISFASLKGKLPMPMRGTVIRPPGGHDRNLGVFIQSRSSGATVKAVFAGKVEFAGRLKGYGKIVVINHGSHFYTVYACLSRIDMKEGQRVRQGDVVGFAEKIMELGKARLYFEVRKGKNGLDPFEWLKGMG